MSRAEIEEAVRYHHPEKALAALPTRPRVGDEALAPLFGTDVGTYRQIRAGFAERARRCARGLLRDARFARSVDRLPFEPGTTVVGLGDSITDDLLSWLEILRHLLAERRPDDAIRVVNAGISGDTTTGLLARLPYVLEEDPAWIIVMIGTNDAASIREPPTKTRVSPEEIGKNLRALRDLVEALSDARLAWITPPPAIEAPAEATLPGEPSWHNADLAGVARIVREAAGEDPLVETWEVFGDPPEPALFLLDGLHPSLAGQKAIAAALVERLAAGDPA